ncbi:hypothetical protein Micbo1qcDRAFT_169698, partial [Microdochium bolleyi]
MTSLTFRLSGALPPTLAGFLETLPRSEPDWANLARSWRPSSTSMRILSRPLQDSNEFLRSYLKHVDALPRDSAERSYAQFIALCLSLILLREGQCSNDSADQTLQAILGQRLSQDRLRKRRNG